MSDSLTLRAAVGSDNFDDGPLGATAFTNAGGTTYYARDPQGNLIDEHGASGTYDYLTDRNNSVLALINSSGAANPRIFDLYAYAGSDPIDNTDPTGHPSIIGDFVAGLVGGVIGLGGCVHLGGESAGAGCAVSAGVGVGVVTGIAESLSGSDATDSTLVGGYAGAGTATLGVLGAFLA